MKRLYSARHTKRLDRREKRDTDSKYKLAQNEIEMAKGDNLESELKLEEMRYFGR